MKELSIEQKARAYDEAIDKVAHFIKKHIGLGCVINPNSSEAKELFNIFLELKESEDEKIRKEIISFIKDDINEINLKMSGDYDDRDDNDIAHQNWCKKAIAWLEKQNPNVDNANKEYWRGYREGKQEILDKYAELEKQGEQKNLNIIDISEKEKQDMQEENLNSHTELFDINKQGEQNLDWSEEDEKIIKRIDSLLYAINESEFEDIHSWLKSLKNRYTWKPSNEQMHAFEQVYDWYNNNFAPSETLTSLYDDLKKLKGE